MDPRDTDNNDLKFAPNGAKTTIASGIYMMAEKYDGREGSHWRCGDAMDDEAMRWTMRRCDGR